MLCFFFIFRSSLRKMFFFPTFAEKCANLCHLTSGWSSSKHRLWYVQFYSQCDSQRVAEPYRDITVSVFFLLLVYYTLCSSSILSYYSIIQSVVLYSSNRTVLNVSYKSFFLCWREREIYIPPLRITVVSSSNASVVCTHRCMFNTLCWLDEFVDWFILFHQQYEAYGFLKAKSTSTTSAFLNFIQHYLIGNMF